MCPSYISRGGELHPATEHAVLPHLSGTPNEVYDGPDRAAMAELAEAHGVDDAGKPKKMTFGIHFKNDPDLINRARSLGFKDVKEFAQAMGYNETPETEAKLEEEKAKVIVRHVEPKRGRPNKKLGGGTDTSGAGNDHYGDFGERPAL
jgi:hypothetical protein